MNFSEVVRTSFVWDSHVEIKIPSALGIEIYIER